MNSLLCGGCVESRSSQSHNSVHRLLRCRIQNGIPETPFYRTRNLRKDAQTPQFLEGQSVRQRTAFRSSRAAGSFFGRVFLSVHRSGERLSPGVVRRVARWGIVVSGRVGLGWIWCGGGSRRFGRRRGQREPVEERGDLSAAEFGEGQSPAGGFAGEGLPVGEFDNQRDLLLRGLLVEVWSVHEMARTGVDDVWRPV
jgi:hypothetical protein